MAHTIEVNRIHQDYKAHIQGTPLDLSATGRTPSEAIGELVRKYPDELGLTIVRNDRREAQKAKANRTTPHLFTLHR